MPKHMDLNFDYRLMCDSIYMKTIKATQRFGYANLIYYTLATIEEIEGSEPRSFREAIRCIEGPQW